jgi:hypothetical protein
VFGFKFNLPFDQGINGVIFAQADVCPRPEFGPILAHNDIAGNDVFPTVTFNAQSF